MALSSREQLPESSRPDLDIEGRSIDEIRQTLATSQLNASLLENAQKCLVTQYSRYLLAGAGGIGAYVAGAMAGGGLGYAAGYIGISVASYITEQVTGAPIAKELADLGGQAIESISSTASVAAQAVPQVISEWFPSTDVNIPSSDLMDNITNIGTTFYAHVTGGISGLSLAGFVGQRTAPYGWAKGDSLGQNIGTKVSLPFMRLHARARRIPQEMSNLFEA